ncbi:MAG: GNAT family N-acetyltransferase [Caulobacterales bacterium]|nr:GNAT family N-acetyltransferase [Caulobacterales bacterium]
MTEPTTPPAQVPLPPTPILETARLILRPLEARDVPATQRIFPRWEVVRYLLDRVPWPYPADGAATNFADCKAKRARGEQLYWAITLKGGDDELVGRIDLRPDDGDHEMRGFWLDPQLAGQGLMTEAAEAVTRFAFEDLGWDELWVTNAASNRASSRIKVKQGFELVEIRAGQFVFGPDDREVWRLTRAAWLARGG